MSRIVAAIVSVAFLVGCTRAPAPAPPRVAKVAVLPVGNRTGDTLLVAGGSVIEKYALGTPRVTVADLLQFEAGQFLRERGVQVADPEALVGVTAERVSDLVAALAAAKFDGAALRLDVWRWEPDAGTHPAFVIVGLDAVLIDVASGRTVWQWRRPPRPVPTQGAVTLGGADQIAARAAVADVLDAWKTARSRPGD
jgi:hypothetical protein